MLTKQTITNLIRRSLLVVTISTLLGSQAHAQYAYGDHWYQNPLGFDPLKLHTSMGVLVPGVILGAYLLFSKADTSQKDRFTIYCQYEHYWGYKYPYTLMRTTTAGINWQVRRYASVGAETGVIIPKDEFNQTAGYYIRPFARFYAFNRNSWKLYFESGGGLIYTQTEFPKPTDRDPRLGLRLNGITKYGIGLEAKLSRKLWTQVGVRHLHISNGNTKGVERNPSHDSNGFYVGVNLKM